MPESTMKVTNNTVTITELLRRRPLEKGQTVQLKDADPSELQLFMEKMPASIKGKTKSEYEMEFPILCLILVLEQRGIWLSL